MELQSSEFEGGISMVPGGVAAVKKMGRESLRKSWSPNVFAKEAIKEKLETMKKEEEVQNRAVALSV
jgi:hypothetical protein